MGRISTSLMPLDLAFSLKIRYFSFNSQCRMLSLVRLSPISFASFRRVSTLYFSLPTSCSFQLSRYGSSLSFYLALSISRFFIRSMSQKALAISSGGVNLDSSSALQLTISCEFSAKSRLYLFTCSNSFSSCLSRSFSTFSFISTLKWSFSSTVSYLHASLSLRFSLMNLSPSTFSLQISYRRPSTTFVFALRLLSSDAVSPFIFSLASLNYLTSFMRDYTCFFSVGGREVSTALICAWTRELLGVCLKCMILTSFIEARFWQLGQLLRYSNC